MGIILRYSDGRLEQAFLLAVRGNVLRVLRPGYDDTAEFMVHEGGLLSEANEPVEIEFMDLDSMLEAVAAPEGPQMAWVASPCAGTGAERRTLAN